MSNKEYKTNLASTEAIIQVVTALSAAIREPSRNPLGRSLDVEQKVGSSLNRQLSRYTLGG